MKSSQCYVCNFIRLLDALIALRNATRTWHTVPSQPNSPRGWILRLQLGEIVDRPDLHESTAASALSESECRPGQTSREYCLYLKAVRNVANMSWLNRDTLRFASVRLLTCSEFARTKALGQQEIEMICFTNNHTAMLTGPCAAGPTSTQVIPFLFHAFVVICRMFLVPELAHAASWFGSVLACLKIRRRLLRRKRLSWMETLYSVTLGAR